MGSEGLGSALVLSARFPNTVGKEGTSAVLRPEEPAGQGGALWQSSGTARDRVMKRSKHREHVKAVLVHTG